MKFYRIIFCAVIVCSIYLIFNYELNWVHPEMSDIIEHTMRIGSAISLKDLFPYENFFEPARLRFICFLLLKINIRFRLWLWHYIPPHPSLALTWLFTLILSPILMFNFVYNFIGERIIAWIALILYMVSSAFLSGINLFFIPAKPMTNFFAILCLYIASKMKVFIDSGKYFSRKVMVLYVFLLTVLFISFLTDEMTFLAYFCLPFLFVGIFNGMKRKKILYFLYFLPFILFIIFAFILEMKTQSYFFYYLLHGFKGGHCGGWGGFKIVHFLTNFYNTLSINLSPFHFIFGAKEILMHRIIFFIFLCLLFIYFKIPDRKKVLRSAMAAAFFLIGYAFFSQFYGGGIMPGSVYGSMFSIFFVLPVSILLFQSGKILGQINKIIFILFVIAYLQNHIYLTKFWINSHYNNSISADGKLTFSMVRDAWNNRANNAVLFRMQEKYPKKAEWLFTEFKYLNHN